MPFTSPKTLLAAALSVLMLAPAVAAAADYPTKPIRLLVPYPAGGPNDVLARLLSVKLGESLGQQVVVENRAGAGGNIAAEAVAKSPNDGYTLLLPALAYAANPALFSKVPYKFADFAPVSVFAKGPLVLVAHPSLGAKSVRDVLALAKAKPGTLSYASGGAGSSPHLAGELFKSVAAVDLLHVPYKGTAEFMSDLLAGRVPLSFSSPLVIKPHVQSGALLALGVTSPQRSPGWPGVPSIAEAGVPGYDVEAWYALLAPAGTPAEAVNKLNTAINDALKAPDVQARMGGLGVDPVQGTPAQAAAYLDAEARKWTKVIRDAGIKLD